jgi:hypothetical protein
MQTTLRLDDELFRRAKTQAAARGISLTKLVEEAIQEHLDKPAPAPRQRRLRLPVSTSTGGLVPEFSTLEEAIAAVDLADDQRRAG